MHKHAQNVRGSRDEDALFEALEQEGCPICLVTLEAMQRVMDTWQYEGFSDAENRQTLVRSRGFCPRHTWQLAHLPVAFQLALVYHDTLSELLTSAKWRTPQPPLGKHKWFGIRGWSGWRRLREKKVREEVACLFCQRQREIEARLVTTVVAMLSSELFCQKLSQATGLCLPHFTQTYHAIRNEEQRAILQECQCACLRRLQGELAELLRKHDYRFRQEPRGNEMKSWYRAVELFAGSAGVR